MEGDPTTNKSQTHAFVRSTINVQDDIIILVVLHVLK